MKGTISPIHQAKRIVRYVGDEMLKTGQPVMAGEIPEIMGSANEQMTWAVVDGLCEKRKMRRGPNVKDFDGVFRAPLTLTLDGWEQYEAEKQRESSGKYGFMAMAFNKPELEPIVRCLKKQIRQEMDCELLHMGDRERAGILDNFLRMRIRESAFVIADLTHDNAGAYWEAGYAEGLGKPVIYTCERTKFRKEKTHFDTSHSTTITWARHDVNEFADRLIKALRNSLESE